MGASTFTKSKQTKETKETKAVGFNDYSALAQPVVAPVIYNKETPIEPLLSLEKKSALVECPFCQKKTMSTVEGKASKTTRGLAAAFALCITVLVIIPFVTEMAYNYNHYCSACKKQLTHKHHGEATVMVEDAKKARAQEGKGADSGFVAMPAQYKAWDGSIIKTES